MVNYLEMNWFAVEANVLLFMSLRRQNEIALVKIDSKEFGSQVKSRSV